MLMIYFIIAVILTETITELVVKSYFFEPVRKFFFARQEKNCILDKISYLLECGYCFSVWSGWISIIIVLTLYRSFVVIELSMFQLIVGVFVFGLISHRLANILHYLIDRLRG